MNLHRIVAGVIALALVSSPVCLRAAEPVLFVPRGGWTANFADDSCSLERSFAHEEDTLRLRLRQFAPGSMLEITVASATLDAREGQRAIQFAAGGGVERIDFYQPFESPGLEGVVFSASLSMPPTSSSAQDVSDYSIYATGSTIDGLTLSKAFGTDLRIQTGSLEQPLKIMGSCLDDLLTRWGLDPQAHRTLSRKAEPNWHDGWLSVTAPMQRDFIRQKGSVRQDVRLIVDELGKVAACRVLQWPEDEPIARRMCDVLIARARIAPALDSESNPVRSYFVLVLSAVPRG